MAKKSKLIRLDKVKRVDGESSYRRGYAQGYHQAVEDTGYYSNSRCWCFWDDELTAWRNAKNKKRANQPPPKIEKSAWV